MIAVILAGGLGTRLAEETDVRPKPMVEIGGRPIIWHIMKHLNHYGINEFIICLGYKGFAITNYFLNYMAHTSDVTIDIKRNDIRFFNNELENWKVTLVNTGLETGTGGRLRRIVDFLDQENFLFTYGDGLSNVNIHELIAFHNRHGRMATVTAVQPAGRYGNLTLKEDEVTKFSEKSLGEDVWVSGGFFILNPKVINLIDSDSTNWEEGPVSELAQNSQLMAYQHRGFWHGVDTLRDKHILETMWRSNNAPWQI